MTIRIKRCGRFRSFRRLYFRRRSEPHLRGIEELREDIEMAIKFLESIENKTGEFDLVAPPLRKMSIRLCYMESRRLFKSDQECFREIAGRYFLTPDRVRRIVFDKWVKSARFLKSEK